jgi:hypothetical protein
MKPPIFYILLGIAANLILAALVLGVVYATVVR